MLNQVRCIRLSETYDITYLLISQSIHYKHQDEGNNELLSNKDWRKRWVSSAQGGQKFSTNLEVE